MNTYRPRPSKSARACLAVAAVVATVAIASFIDRLAVGYSSAGELAAEATAVVIAARR